MRLSSRKADPQRFDCLGTQDFGCPPKGGCRTCEDQHHQARHCGRGDKHRLSRQLFLPASGRSLTPWPVGKADKPFHEPAEDRGEVAAVYRRTKHQRVRGFNFLEDRLHVILLRTFAAFQSWRLHAGAAVPAELDVLLGQIDGVGRRTLFSGTLQDRFYRSVDDLALPVTAHNRHNLFAHVMSPLAVSAVYSGVGSAFSDVVLSRSNFLQG
jgi:hypothetical protein